MEKENWFKRMYTKKRFWGVVFVAIGGLLTPTPFGIASPWIVSGGFTLLGAGLIDKADSMKEDKAAKKAVAAKEGSDDQK